MLLYERFLGRPFAGHRDSVSELVGDILESAIEAQLDNAKISFRKTKRAERVNGFDQAPDFIIPDEFNPEVVIEAKITEDDGTARDKVTRVQHLGSLDHWSESTMYSPEVCPDISWCIPVRTIFPEICAKPPACFSPCRLSFFKAVGHPVFRKKHKPTSFLEPWILHLLSFIFRSTGLFQTNIVLFPNPIRITEKMRSFGFAVRSCFDSYF